MWTANTSDATKTTSIDKTLSADDLAATIAEPASVSAFTDLPAGVTATAVNVYKAESDPILLIPSTGLPKLDVTIEYVVRTQDSNLNKGYSETVNKISKTIDLGSAAVQPNKLYSLTIILGLTSVKFNATVQDWEVPTGAGSASTEVTLPANVE